jgi:nucleotide-binding universal stress UspA family protein
VSQKEVRAISVKKCFEKILIAVDDSAIAAQAADVGIELAKSLHTTVGFVYVFDPSRPPGTMWGLPADRISEMSEQLAERLLSAFCKRAASRSQIRAFVESGDPASRVVEVAKNWRADLIVMGSHGRGTIKGLVLGSVSKAVLRRAPCPVLIVRPQR